MKKTFKFVVMFFVLLQITACTSIVVVETPVEVEIKEPIVVPPLEYQSFVSWHRPFNIPMPEVEGEIVLAFDDFGNAQLFYSCSQEKIEQNLQLEKFEGMYFSVYWGYDRDVETVLKDAESRIDVDSMARFVEQETWQIAQPEVVTCARKVVNLNP
jgi:hypothetical protein